MHRKHMEWFEQRAIPSDIAEQMGINSEMRDGELWLSIPYYLDGKLVNRKYRHATRKEHSQDKNGKACLWNADALSLGGEFVITEGEFDALAAMTAGYSRVVSVPCGAPAKRVEDPFTATRYEFMWESEEALKKIDRFVLATDADAPGQALAHDLAAILGPERCCFVRYPEGCKDLNDVLVKLGASAVVRCIEEAQPVPVVGLYRMSDFTDQAELPSMTTGIDCLDENMRIVLGSFTVFSGYSNMGKSTVLNTILASAIARGVNVCIASFETAPKPILRNELARALIGCSFEEFPTHKLRKDAYETLERQVTIISNSMDDDAEIDLEQYLELIRIAVIRDGAKIVVLDPWNELEHKRGRDETETDYIGRAIRTLKRFAKRYNVALWVVAHPTKPMKLKDGTIPVPSLYDISGSANWSNKADYGLIYHRADKTKNEGTLAVVKVRMGFPGQCGVVEVMRDEQTSRIVEYGVEIYRSPA
ncbi:DnaB-like helicase C-terminal domain-containing protein [Novosphingobium sp. HII-3]|uniref:AAA family ATPase n=1 Tax=Novosphingobium sp. HII-3 TaxID=2075565 RepID=UPI000CDAD865|nr:DnaB-like helicase C-terminal domain-containing protein [Novosphingobium sp. HII-3]